MLKEISLMPRFDVRLTGPFAMGITSRLECGRFVKSAPQRPAKLKLLRLCWGFLMLVLGSRARGGRSGGARGSS